MTKNKYYNALIDFINSHEDWEVLLKKSPYNMKTIKRCETNPNWVMFVYNLFDSDLQNDVVKACRGSVLEIVDNKVIRPICMPFTKFTNYGQFPEDDLTHDWSTSKCFLKVDGILIKMFKVNGICYWVSNGSFDLNSELPNEYDSVINEESTKDAKTYADLLEYALTKNDKVVCKKEVPFTASSEWMKNIPDGWTLTFELVSPRNRIICEYSETELYFHGVRDSNGVEHNPLKVAEAFHVPYKTPKEFDLNNIDDIRNLLSSMQGKKEEGIVTVDKSFHRIKIKCDSYLNLKFVKGEGNFSKKCLFKYVINDDWDDIVGNFPSIKPVIDEISEEIKNFKSLFNFVMNKYREVLISMNNNYKEYSSFVFKEYKDYSNILFLVKKDTQSILDCLFASFYLKKNGYKLFLDMNDKLKELK